MDGLRLQPPSPVQRPESCATGKFTVALPEQAPYHWQCIFEKSWPWTRPYLAMIWGFFCSIAFGQSGLEEAWDRIRGSEAEFQEYINRANARVSNLTIVAGLFLGSVSTLLTAEPPMPEMFKFTIRSSYLLTGCCFGILLGGILCGFGVMHIMSTCTRQWVVECLCANRGRIWCMLILVSYPFISFFAALHCLIAGFLVTHMSSDDLIIKIGSIFLYIVPFSLYIPVFILSRPPASVRRRKREHERRHHELAMEAHDETKVHHHTA
ncbi:hypothetical protein BKA62DRAFT_688386 [Auriculariales sp. MPI-PUGE-AT-0066]|nr:hypothetical protein BKA62DRAFT_688386 [Auriculariales sp. MPI-PUGE-AT-0066]